MESTLITNTTHMGIKEYLSYKWNNILRRINIVQVFNVSISVDYDIWELKTKNTMWSHELW
jgi:hypothetical protein